MEILSAIALILLTLVGYSGGSVLAAGPRKAAPGVLDIFVNLVLWTGALMTRSDLGRWTAVLVWIGIGLVVGAVITFLRRSSFPLADVQEPVQGLWQHWLRFSRKLGDFQGRIFLTWFYFIIVTPFGIIGRLFSDRMNRKTPTGTSAWHTRKAEPAPGVEEARRQF
ncbi:MAG: hypothetical protein DWQ07_09610 [Chloroflexi bacterium]|nr:MAG: hypothetical protein DWQ07_09610 [Chloroflexota bacterium]MBL1193030.1 hypothetical protein [Chloroflexota bacterium]NOH10323.1 hypothetical protein [Chloroflexota bacterium]